MKAGQLADYVDMDILNELGFNEYETSTVFSKNFKSCSAHIGYYHEKESVLIIIRAQTIGKGRKRVEWFFNAVPSEGIYNLDGCQSQERLSEVCVSTVSRKNRIAGRVLEERLRKIAILD